MENPLPTSSIEDSLFEYTNDKRGRRGKRFKKELNKVKDFVRSHKKIFTKLKNDEASKANSKKA